MYKITMSAEDLKLIFVFTLMGLYDGSKELSCFGNWLLKLESGGKKNS